MTTPPPHLPAPVPGAPATNPDRRGGVSRWPLERTLLGAVVSGAGVTWGMYWLLGRAVVIDYAEGLTGAQRLTAAFAAATAIGAIVALVVNVRKQDLAERTAAQAEAQYAETIFRDREAAFTDRFRAASQQLGAAAPPERIAGVYAMAALADDYPDRRQQCVDVLCGYLRLPWDPDLDDLAATSTTVTDTGPDGNTTAQTTTPARRPHDAQVRATIMAVIAAHTRDPNASTTWTPLRFDLRGTHLCDADLGRCSFAGSVSLDGATFSGEITSFLGATFSGEHTSFYKARFSAENVWFNDARFSGGNTSFAGAVFSGESTSFAGATFLRGDTSFAGATFLRGITSFAGATFSRANAWFSGTRFSGATTSFDRATFSGASTSFDGSMFSGATTSFDRATFSEGWTSFDGSMFSGATTSFDRATFSEGKTSFSVAVVLGRALLRLPKLADPHSMLAGLRIEDGGEVFVDDEAYTPPDPPQTEGEGSSS